MESMTGLTTYMFVTSNTLNKNVPLMTTAGKQLSKMYTPLIT